MSMWGKIDLSVPADAFACRATRSPRAVGSGVIGTVQHLARDLGR